MQVAAPEQADAVVDRIVEAAERLVDFPRMGRPLPESIGDYYLHVAPAYAEAMIPALIHSTEPLASFPQLGRRVPEFVDRFRELIFEGFRIVYSIEPGIVTILQSFMGRWTWRHG